MASRTSIENGTQEITSLFSKANKAILALIVANYARAGDTSDTFVSLGVMKILSNLEKKAFPLIKKQIEWHYISSLKQADANILRDGVENVIKGLTEVDKLKIKGMVSQAFYEYEEAVKGEFMSAQKLMTMVKQERLKYILTPEGLNSFNQKQLKKDIVENLSKDLTSLTYRSGRRWKLETYAEMLSRTKLTEVSNNGMTDRLLNSGYDLVQVTVHGTDCELCKPYEGKILSMTGRTAGFPTVDEAESNGLMHPNCRHRYVKAPLGMEN